MSACKGQTGTQANHVWKLVDTVIENYSIIKVLRCSLCGEICRIIDGKLIYPEEEIKTEKEL